MKRLLLTIAIVFFFTHLANAKVNISEVAWMGTTTSANDEWIELYNDSSSSVDLSGWSIEGSINITIPEGKSIAGNGLFLMERTDDTTVPNVIADYIYTGALTNSGYQSFIIKDGNGSTVESLVFQTEWPAGDNTTKDTMQWSGSSWTTGTPSPKSMNTGVSSTTNDEEDDSGATTVISSSSKAETAPNNTPHIEFVIPKVINTNVPTEYKATVFLDYMIANQGIFVWNMGDGTVIKQTELLPVSHTYKYAGRYTLSFAYYRNSYDTKPYLNNSVSYGVVDATLVVSVADSGNAIEIENLSDKSLDITNWILSDGSIQKYFPEMTIIAPKATIYIPITNFGLTRISKVEILSPNGSKIQSFAGSKYIQNDFAPLIKASAIESSDYKEETIISDEKPAEDTKKQKHTKYIIFGVLSLITIGLIILLERFMVLEE